MDNEKEKKKRAAAISYDPQKDTVPVMSAFGEGHMAEKIIQKAKESDVPVMEDSNLAGMLANLSVGDAIPPQLYEVVARVLVFIGQMDSGKKGKRPGE